MKRSADSITGDSATVSFSTRVPEKIYNAAVASTHQKIGPMFQLAIREYLADPEAIAKNPFYSFAGATARKMDKFIKIDMAVEDREWFEKVEKTLHVFDRDLVANALIKKFKIDTDSFPAPLPLMYDEAKLAELIKQNPYSKARPDNTPADSAREEPLVKIFTLAEMDKEIAATPRSVYVKAGTKAEAEERRKLVQEKPWKDR